MLYSLIKKLLSYKLVRYLISGGTGAVVHIGTVFVLTHLFSVWYRYATIIGFLCAVGISFTMQKFFTFSDMQKNTVGMQSSLFFIIGTINFFANSFLMYLFVEHAGLIPVFAQVVTALTIALWSFFAYARLFRPAPHTPEPNQR